MATASAGMTFDDRAFLRGFEGAVVEFRKDATELVDAWGDEVADTARGLAARGATGDLEASISSVPGEDPDGPFVEVGSRGVRYAIPQEYGTYKMAAHPFMRPSLQQLAKELKLEGLSASLRSGRARANARRAALRTRIRKAYQSGQIGEVEARVLSKTLSQKTRYRGKG